MIAVPRAVRRRAAVLAALLALISAPARSQQGTRDRPFIGTAQVTAVEVVISVEDRDGRLPEDLRPEDFEVFEDGVAVPVVGVEVWRRGTVARRAAEAGAAPRVETSAEPLWTWHTLIYFDQVLSSSRSIRRTAEALAAQAGRLTRLGTVEVVTANPLAERALAPTRSAALVEQTLTRLARETVGRDELRQLRRRLATEQQQVDRRSSGGGEKPLNFRETHVAAAVFQESLLLRRQHDVLTAWLSQELHAGPRALVLVNDGYDLRPHEFYERLVHQGGIDRQVNAEIAAQGAEADVRELSRALAASGWVAVGLGLGALDAGSALDAGMTGRGRSGSTDKYSQEDSIAFGPDALFVRPIEPLRQVAIATGGDVLTGVDGLPAALAALEDKVRLTYQVARLPDGELRPLEVRARRPGLEVSAPRWAGSSAPEGVSAARARRLLAGGGDRGDLPLVAAVALEPAPDDGEEPASRSGKLQARVDLRPLAESLAGAGPAPVRVTVAASFTAGEPFVRHDLVAGQDLAGLDAWTYGLPVTLPGEVEKVSVVFEELTTGAWGGALATLVEGALPAAVEAAGASDAEPAAGPAGGVLPADLLPERKAILLLPPGPTVVRGRVALEPVVGSARIVRVEYRLDGEPVASSSRPPFAAKVDFGALPAPHLVEAVGLDAAGLEVGRDALTVNEGVGSFRVRIVEPRSGDRVGPVDVEAEVKVPGGAGLDRVEVLWNGERVATLFEPPFRSRVFVPPDAPVGWIQVVAHRADGTAAEDLVFLNGTGPAERVDVKLVELFTVVEDPTRHPVRGLAQGDFQVFEDGAEQTIADFRPGAEVPLSLGLLIDTSASMTPALRAAQTAAIDFLLLTLEGEEDRAFVVGFDARPLLVQPLTAERDELVDAIASLRAGGTSALCDAVVFSLVQMQRIPGRRALVVLTDGVGREERIDFGTCLRFVQRSGIPIYAVLLAGDDPTAAASGGVDTETLGRLVGSVGGRLFLVENPRRLGGVYRAVSEELRSQYLLTYYPRRLAAGDEGWREIEVEVERSGLVARTLAGYYP